jgi:tagaturonate reductase
MSPGHPILQFGTSRFLQAHVDLFVSEAAESGQALGGITVVQTSGDATRRARLRGLADPAGFDIVVRGRVDGQSVVEHRHCRSVRAALDCAGQWPEVRETMRRDARVIVSNTGDRGWELHAGDGADLLGDDRPAPAAFPAKLLVLLHDRWQADLGRELTLLPCELVSRNGDRLRDIVTGLARTWSLAPGFVEWLHEHPVWANSLVDRIVSEALEPAGAVAEPYALWAIEQRPRLLLPCRHPAIVLTDALEHHERLKLFLLNLGHTLLADEWLRASMPPDLTVLQAMHEPAMRELLESTWRDEVLPVFDALGQGDAARAYLVTLRDRLLNPFLAHRLADIAQNHGQKVARRAAPVVELAARLRLGLAQPRLRALMRQAVA